MLLYGLMDIIVVGVLLFFFLMYIFLRSKTRDMMQKHFERKTREGEEMRFVEFYLFFI